MPARAVLVIVAIESENLEWGTNNQRREVA